MYIPVVSLANAEALSKRLFQLSRPTSNPDDITDKLLSWVVHPVTGAVMVSLPDDCDLPVSVLSDSRILKPLLNPFVLAGSITDADVTQIETKLATAKGERLKLLDILPDFWVSRKVTREQLEADGWFPEAIKKEAIEPP